jgi:potassium efflux system protein
MALPAKPSLRLFSAFFLLLLVVFCHPLFSDAAEEQTEKAIEPEQALTLISAYSLTNTLPRELVDLQKEVKKNADLEAFKKEFPEVSKQIDTLEWDAVSLKSNSNLTYHDLSSFETKLVKINIELDKINEPIKFHIEHLEQLYKIWLGKEKQLQVLIEQITADPALHGSFPAIDSLTETITTAKNLIVEQIKPNLLAGQQAGQSQTRVYVLTDIVRDLLSDIKKSGTQQTSPAMLSSEFYTQINTQIFMNGWQNIRLFMKYQWSYIKQHLGKILLCTVLILVLAGLIHFSRFLTKPSSQWYPFATRPLASALFILGSGFTILNNLEININLPPEWGTLLYFLPIIAIIFLIDLVIKKNWQTILLKQLLIFLGITLLMTVLDLPQMLSYLLVFYLSVALLSYYFLLFVKRMMVPSERNITWAIVLWAVFPLSVIITGIAGFDQFAVVIFGRVLSIVGATMVVWLMIQLISGMLELVLTSLPIKIIKQNAKTIVNQLTPVIVIAHALLWLTIVLNILWLYPTLNASFEAITSLQFSFFSLIITPGSILAIVFIIYSSILVSRWTRTFLLQEVLPRYKVEQGAQISINRLVHYAILFVGFIILLSTLGFGLNQITIIGGALGVGIGFGLQAIVNNFVSGLILLFERPVKVGDMIEVGPDVGEVKELGLRATTVQTFDNAEIVIPNSQLITGSVVNWTLAEKKIRVKVPVGVAYGSDISAVLKILLTCADDNASVLSKPKPAALFLAFGASSLDFELRAWIADFSNKLNVLSELNQDIEYEFSLAGIRIPFPQADLHLRSVDKSVISKLSDPKSIS